MAEELRVGLAGLRSEWVRAKVLAVEQELALLFWGECLRLVMGSSKCSWVWLHLVHSPTATTEALLINTSAGSFGSTPGSFVWMLARKPFSSAM